MSSEFTKLYVDTLGSLGNSLLYATQVNALMPRVEQQLNLGYRRAGCPFVAGPLALEHSSKYALARWLMHVIVRNALIFHTVVPHATVMPSPWAPRGTSRAAGSGKADAPVRSAHEQARRRAPWTRRDENPTDLGEGYPMPKRGRIKEQSHDDQTRLPPWVRKRTAGSSASGSAEAHERSMDEANLRSEAEDGFDIDTCLSDSDQASTETDSSQERKTVHGFATVVRLFGAGWLSLSTYQDLYDLTLENKVKVLPNFHDSVRNFNIAFTRVRGRRDGDINTRLTKLLCQLRQTRCAFADEYETLSEQNTTDCLWSWANTYLLDEAQLRLPLKKKRSVLNSFLHAHLAGQTRLRAVLQRGLADFASSEEDSALEQFILYILEIEAMVETAQEETRGLAHGPGTRRLPDAPERTTAEANTSRHPPWRSRAT